MKLFFKFFITTLISYFTVYLLDNRFTLSWVKGFFIIAIVTAIINLILFCLRSKFSMGKGEERVCNMRTGAAGEIFSKKKYSKYKKLRSERDGNTYTDSEGNIIRTVYANRKEPFGFYDVMLSIFSAILSFGAWYLEL